LFWATAVSSEGLQVPRSRDPADDKFLEYALAGEADCLVSADADLLSLVEIEASLFSMLPPFSEG
jgi:predicted nucleic acid-binding protein